MPDKTPIRPFQGAISCSKEHRKGVVPMSRLSKRNSFHVIHKNFLYLLANEFFSGLRDIFLWCLFFLYRAIISVIGKILRNIFRGNSSCSNCSRVDPRIRKKLDFWKEDGILEKLKYCIGTAEKVLEFIYAHSWK